MPSVVGPTYAERVREQRLVFGEDAALYDRIRPSYPDELVNDVVALVEPPSRVLDVGCGTGKATVLLAARGLSGIGIEADPAMAAVARENLAGRGGWRIDVAEFESWQPRPVDVPVDLIICAQAWHWLDPELRLQKARDYVRPGGWLALWWNRPDEDSSPVRAAIDAVYEELMPELPSRGIGAQGRPRPDDPPAEAGFGTPIERAYRWSHEYAATEWVDLLRTQSDHRLLVPTRLETLLGAIRAAIDSHGGTYRHLYVCWLWAAERL